MCADFVSRRLNELLEDVRLVVLRIARRVEQRNPLVLQTIANRTDQ